MDNKVSSKKVANNILEFLVDPSAFPLERRLYFGPEELLMNESFEKAKKESQQAYGDQRHNSDFYPHRPVLKREASIMERKHLIASLDVLSQEFIESDPMAKDLRTMAYAVANMSEEELETRAAGNPWIEHMNKVRKSNPGKSFKEIASLAKKTFKKNAEEELLSDESWTKEASDVVQKALKAEITGSACDDKKEEKEEKEKEAGKKKGPGIPDGTGPLSGTPECPKKEAGKKKGPGIPDKNQDGTGPMSGTPACPKSEEPKKEAAEEEPKKEAEATEVDTAKLLESSITEVGGVQLDAGMMTMEDIGDLSSEEQERLGQLFK